MMKKHQRTDDHEVRISTAQVTSHFLDEAFESFRSRCRGKPLTFGQALALDNLLRSYCGLNSDALHQDIANTIGDLERNDKKAAELISDWKVCEGMIAERQLLVA